MGSFFQPFQTINRESSRPEFINYLGWRDLWWHKRRDAYKKYVDVIEALHLYFVFGYDAIQFCNMVHRKERQCDGIRQIAGTAGRHYFCRYLFELHRARKSPLMLRDS